MDNRIVILKGPERIRRRPAVVFGDDNIEGVQNAVCRLLEIYAAEAQLGYCRHLTVTHNDSEVEMRGDDRGFYLGQDKSDDSVWQGIFCDFFHASAFLPEETNLRFGLLDYSHHVLYGEEVPPNATFFPEDLGHFDLCCAQCASKYMDVVCVRNGIKSTLHFRKGHNIGGIRNEPTDESNGTCIRLEMDREVFTQTALSSAFLLKMLKRFAMLVPGFTCTYTNTASGEHAVFLYPNGIADFAKKRVDSAAAGIYTKRIEATGRDRYDRAEYEACIELAIGPAPGKGSALCLHNFRELTCGGTHYKKLQSQVCTAFNNVFLPRLIGDEPEDPVKLVKLRSKHALTFEELRKHLIIVLASWCSPHCSAWENGSRLSIRNTMITDMVSDATRELDCYIYENADALMPVIEKIFKERKRTFCNLSRLFCRFRSRLLPKR